MLYKNTKTGRIVDVESEVGGSWVPVVAPTKPAEPAKKAPKKSAKKTKDEKPDG